MDSSLFVEKLKANHWCEVVSDIHESTGDRKIVERADAYYFFEPENSNIQLSLALFADKKFMRLRIFEKGNDFRWLVIQYKDLEAVLDKIIAEQNEIELVSYLSLMSGQLGPDCKVSLLVWEQFV